MTTYQGWLIEQKQDPKNHFCSFVMYLRNYVGMNKKSLEFYVFHKPLLKDLKNEFGRIDGDGYIEIELIGEICIGYKRINTT